MTAARCWWPLDDLDIEDNRARTLALGQLPVIAAENHWAAYFEPTGWRYEEGTYEGEQTLFLVCDLDVIVTPVRYRPRGGKLPPGSGSPVGRR